MENRLWGLSEPITADLFKWWNPVKVTNGWVVKTGISVTWNILSWSEGHEFKPRSVELGVRGITALSRTWTKTINFSWYTSYMPRNQLHIYYKCIMKEVFLSEIMMKQDPYTHMIYILLCCCLDWQDDRKLVWNDGECFKYLLYWKPHYYRLSRMRDYILQWLSISECNHFIK